MRGSIVSILLAGGMLALGACSTTTAGQRADAALAEDCRGSTSRLFPTGRETGDPRQDYRCLSAHSRAEVSNSNHASNQRAHAVNRSLSRGY